MQNILKRIRYVMVLAIFFMSFYPTTTSGQDFSTTISLLRGSKVIAQDDENTFLGVIDSETRSDSILNALGKYGNELSSRSIWNSLSKFGSEFSQYSAFNKFSSKPPMVIKGGKVIAFLTVNRSIKGAVSPYLLKAIGEDF